MHVRVNICSCAAIEAPAPVRRKPLRDWLFTISDIGKAMRGPRLTRRAGEKQRKIVVTTLVASVAQLAGDSWRA